MEFRCDWCDNRLSDGLQTSHLANAPTDMMCDCFSYTSGYIQLPISIGVAEEGSGVSEDPPMGGSNRT